MNINLIESNTRQCFMDNGGFLFVPSSKSNYTELSILMTDRKTYLVNEDNLPSKEFNFTELMDKYPVFTFDKEFAYDKCFTNWENVSLIINGDYSSIY